MNIFSFQPPPNAKLPKKLKSKAKTALQVRNEEDRNKQITEAVMAILVCETTSSHQKTYTNTESKLNCLQGAS